MNPQNNSRKSFFAIPIIINIIYYDLLHIKMIIHNDYTINKIAWYLN
jgi:hypothetical protein